jgi:hypothetical protein
LKQITICFEANNYLQEKNTASKKIAIVAGEPGTRERIETYRKNVELGLTIEGKPVEL